MIIFKRLFIRFLTVLLALQGVMAVSLLSPIAAHAAGGLPEVVINEVQWMGSRSADVSHPTDKWIELFNTNLVSPSGDIDLTGWSLTNVGLAAGALDGITIPAQGYLVLSPTGLAETVLDLPASDPLVQGHLSAGLAIPDTCPGDAGGVELMNGAIVVDSVGCSGSSPFWSWPAGYSSLTVKQGMERRSPELPGSLTSSWSPSYGFVHMIAAANGQTIATPGFVNDETAADPGTIIDVRDFSQTADVDFTADSSALRGRWTPWTDAESGIDHYEVAFSAINSIPASGWQPIYGVTEATVIPPSKLTPGSTYYFAVRAVNGAGVKGLSRLSDGIVFDQADPLPAANVQAVDLANDNGGAITVSWDASASVDEITYQVAYKKTIEPTYGSPLPAVPATNLVVTGLENDPTQYDFQVTAVDFNNQASPPAYGSGMAQDNLAPTLDSTKVTVGQNKPGTIDTIAGSAGAVSEPVTVNFYDQDPAAVPGALLIASTTSAADGSFPMVAIGNNTLPTVYVRLADLDTGVAPSAVYSFSNDIVAPNAPTLTRLESDCKTDSCRVELQWQDNGPDSASYQVGYRVNGVEQRTLPVTTTVIRLDLPTNASYEFAVYAFDAAGNESTKSNVFTLALVSGVAATIVLENGQPVVTVRAVPGSKDVIRSTVADTIPAIVGSAKAAEPTSQPQVADQQQNNPNPTKSQDWLRIFVVVLLLLIVAGGFYALSRSFNESEEVLIATAPPAKKRGRPKKNGSSTKPRRQRRRP